MAARKPKPQPKVRARAAVAAQQRRDVDMEAVVERALSLSRRASGVSEAEAYGTWNAFTMARIETIGWAGTTRPPSVMQLKRLDSYGVSVRVVINGAVGTANTSDLSVAGLRRLVDRAVGAVRIMPPDPNFVSLPKPIRRAAPKLPRDDAILLGSVEEGLADAAEEAIAAVPDGLQLAGSIMAVGSEVSVANTHGIELHGHVDTFTAAQFTVERMEGPKASSSGMGWSTGRRMSDLDPADAAFSAASLAGEVPRRSTVPEGDYNVIMGQYTVADVLDNMMPYCIDLGSIYQGFCWMPTERRKLANGREASHPALGSRVGVEGFSMSEDPTLETGMLSHAFDDEGLPARRVDIVRDGVFEDVIGSTYWSYLYGREPAGSALRKSTVPGRCACAAPRAAGTNLVVAPGDMSFEELVEASRGRPTIYIPRTWYTYPTRYGAPGFSSSNRSTAFVVERGELVPVAPNAFKLTGDVLKILGSIYGIGKEVKTATTWVASRAPVVPMLAARGVRVSKPAGEA